MCGRYVRRSDKQRIAEYFHAKPQPVELPMPGEDYNVAPTTYQPIIRQSRELNDRELVLARWSLVPFFTKGVHLLHCVYSTAPLVNLLVWITDVNHLAGHAVQHFQQHWIQIMRFVDHDVIGVRYRSRQCPQLEVPVMPERQCLFPIEHRLPEMAKVLRCLL